MEEAVAAVHESLVVGQDRVNAAVFEGVRAEAFRVEVTTEQQEKIRVVLEVVVDRRALRAEARRVSLTDDAVAGNDRPAFRIGLQQGVRPVEDRLVRGGIIGEVDRDEIQSADAPELMVVGIF